MEGKIIIAGDANVGKTSLYQTYKALIDGRNVGLDPKLKSTICANFNTISREFNGENKDFQIWDTAGGEKYSELMPQYFRDAKGALLVFALTEKDTFSHIENWKKLVKENCAPDCKIVYVGNKSDLEMREVPKAPREIWGDDDHVYFECSAITGENVLLAFDGLLELVANADETVQETHFKECVPKNQEKTEEKSSSCC